MSPARPLVLLPLAGGMLALAMIDGAVPGMLASVGVPGDAVATVAPWLSTALAAGGFALLVGTLVTVARGASLGARWGPYRAALGPFAAEYGRGVIQTEAGIEVSIQRNGQRVEIRLGAGPDGRLVVMSPAPARQALAWFRRGAPPPGPAAAWREVEARDGWQFRAELPVMARPLLSDPGLVSQVDAFFANADANAITHLLGGISIEGAIPPHESVAQRTRAAVELAFSLRRVNG